MKPILSVLMFCLLAAQAWTAEKPLEFSDVNGRAHTPLVAGDKKAVVLIFISRDCPISNAFVPEMNRIAADYGSRAAIYLVQADVELSADEARKHAELFQIKPPVLLDPQLQLARRTKARVTPEAVVITPGGETVYQGRINDLYAALTKKRAEPTTHDLRSALDALLSGKPVPTASTKAIGCSISGVN